MHEQDYDRLSNECENVEKELAKCREDLMHLKEENASKSGRVSEAETQAAHLKETSADLALKLERALLEGEALRLSLRALQQEKDAKQSTDLSSTSGSDSEAVVPKSVYVEMADRLTSCSSCLASSEAQNQILSAEVDKLKILLENSTPLSKYLELESDCLDWKAGDRRCKDEIEAVSAQIDDFQELMSSIMMQALPKLLQIEASIADHTNSKHKTFKPTCEINVMQQTLSEFDQSSERGLYYKTQHYSARFAVALKVDADFQLVTQTDQILNSVLESDVSTALGIPASAVTVLCHQRGSVITEVALAGPETGDSWGEGKSAQELAEELVRQARDKDSLLRKQHMGQMCRGGEVHGPMSKAVCDAVAASYKTLLDLLQQSREVSKDFAYQSVLFQTRNIKAAIVDHTVSRVQGELSAKDSNDCSPPVAVPLTSLRPYAFDDVFSRMLNVASHVEAVAEFELQALLQLFFGAWRNFAIGGFLEIGTQSSGRERIFSGVVTWRLGREAIKRTVLAWREVVCHGNVLEKVASNILSNFEDGGTIQHTWAEWRIATVSQSRQRYKDTEILSKTCRESPPKSSPMAMSLCLDYDFKSFATDDQARNSLTSGLQGDISTALGIPASAVTVLCHQRGSVITEVALAGPETGDSWGEGKSAQELAEELVRQARDKDSLLRKQHMGQMCRGGEVHGPVSKAVCDAVVASQGVLMELLGDARNELKSLLLTKGKLEAEADTAALSAEVARLHKVVECMVDRGALETAQDEARQRGLEVERLERVAQGMVPRTQYETAMDEVRRGEAEVERLTKQLSGMVSEAKLQAEQEETATLRAEVERLREVAQSVVPKTALQAAHCQIEVLAAQNKRLESAMETMVPFTALEMMENQLDHVHSQMQVLENHVDRFEVVATLLAESQRELKWLQTEMAAADGNVQKLKQSSLVTMHSLVQATAEQSSALGLLAQLRDDLKDFVPRNFVTASRAEEARFSASMERFLIESDMNVDAIEQLVRETLAAYATERAKETSERDSAAAAVERLLMEGETEVDAIEKLVRETLAVHAAERAKETWERVRAAQAAQGELSSTKVRKAASDSDARLHLLVTRNVPPKCPPRAGTSNVHIFFLGAFAYRNSPQAESIVKSVHV